MDESIVNDLDNLYRDKLTGLWKMEYLGDQVITKLYDSKENYALDISRFVFTAEILGFDRFNTAYGHETVDKLLIQVVRKVREGIDKSGKHQDDILLRYGAGVILGYINDSSLMQCVDLFMSIYSEIKGINIRSGELEVGKVMVNSGVYEERKGTNLHMNIEISKKLLYHAKINDKNNIAFIKDPNHVVIDRDMDRFDDFKDDLVTVI